MNGLTFPEEDDIMVLKELYFDWQLRQTIGYGCTRLLPSTRDENST